MGGISSTSKRATGDTAVTPRFTRDTVLAVPKDRMPDHAMLPNREDLVVLRVVVRNGFSHDMAELFLRDVRVAVDWLDGLLAPMPQEKAPAGFHH